MYGTWILASGKSFRKVFADALRPHQFRERVRNEMTTNDTPMENAENLRRRVRHLAVKWPNIQQVVDAAVLDYGRGRGRRGRAVGDERDRRDLHPRQGVHPYPGLRVTYESGLVRDQRGRLNDHRGRQVA